MPFTRSSVTVRPGASSSSFSFRISRVRSRPVIAFHNAHAAQRFCESSSNFSRDFWSRAENGANRRKSFVDPEPKNQEYPKSDSGHRHAGMNQVNHGDDRGHQSADKLHKSRSD